MKTVHKAIALALATSLTSARAEAHGGGGDSGLVIIDILLNLFTLGVEVAAIDAANRPPPPPEARPPPSPQESYAQRAPDDDDPPRGRYVTRRRFEARQGLLMSFGVGGGSIYVSNQAPTRTGAFDLDFRLGYGFSDRFQFFMDLGLDAANYRNGLYGSDDVASWTFTFRGQTVLVGDRAGNGLNLNLGIGLGGVSRNTGYTDQYSSATGLALAGGLSYDARISPWFSLSPELFYTWHAIPDVPGAHDVASMYGVRVNFLWYLH
jgi:hypothetical protein